MCAKHYENLTMLSKVTAKNVGDVFLRHTVEEPVNLCPAADSRAWELGEEGSYGTKATNIQLNLN